MEFIIEDKKTPIDLQHHTHVKLSDLVEKSNALQKLHAIFESIVDPALARHCTVANLKDGILVILTDSASWSTKIRFSTPELIKQLKVRPKYSNIKKIKCLVRPKEAQKKEKIKNKLTLTAKNANFIKTTANGIKDEKLREALLRLAKNGNNR